MKRSDVLDSMAKDAVDLKERKVASDLVKIASELRELESKTRIYPLKRVDKKAALITAGMTIVCVQEVQGIFKGRLYTAGDYAEPNYMNVYELDSDKPVGIFRADRFLPHWNGY